MDITECIEHRTFKTKTIYRTIITNSTKVLNLGIFVMTQRYAEPPALQVLKELLTNKEYLQGNMPS